MPDTGPYGEKFPAMPFAWGLRPWLALTLLLLATFGAYLSILNADFIILDDGMYVLDNRQVQAGLTGASLKWAFTSIYPHNWHPLTWLSLMLDYEIWGLDPTGFHLGNLLWHLANTVLVLVVFTRMTGSFWKSFVAATIFALHPLRVESVAWISERKDVLSGFFGLLTIAMYCWYAAKKSWARYFLVSLCLALGLMSKPMLVTWPLVLLLLDYWPLNRFRTAPSSGTRTRLVVEKIPWLLLSLASSLVTLWAQATGGQGSAMASTLHTPIPARSANALVAYLTYLSKTLWPNNLAIFYPWPSGGPSLATATWAGIILTLVSLLALMAVRGRPALAVGWLWFLGTLVPVIGLVQVGAQTLADRYVYLPQIGLIVMLVWGLGSYLPNGRRWLAGIISGVVLVTAGLFAATQYQVHTWADTKTVFEHAARVTQRNYLAYTCLGIYAKLEGNPELAIRHLTLAVNMEPGYALAQRHLGFALVLAGRTAEARGPLSEALRLNPGDQQARQVLETITPAGP